MPLYKNDPKLENKDEPTKTKQNKKKMKKHNPSLPSLPSPQWLPRLSPNTDLPARPQGLGGSAPSMAPSFCAYAGRLLPSPPLCLPSFVLQIGILLPRGPALSASSSPTRITPLPTCWPLTVPSGGPGVENQNLFFIPFSGLSQKPRWLKTARQSSTGQV